MTNYIPILSRALASNTKQVKIALTTEFPRKRTDLELNLHQKASINEQALKHNTYDNLQLLTREINDRFAYIYRSIVLLPDRIRYSLNYSLLFHPYKREVTFFSFFSLFTSFLSRLSFSFPSLPLQCSATLLYLTK